jgi:hypothetical protein
MAGILDTLGKVGGAAAPWMSIANGVFNLGSSIIQGSRARKMGKELDALSANRPKYEIPKEYQDILAKYQQAQQSNMPGYEQTLSQMGQAGARARGSAERGAISSSAYGAQVGDIYQKELDAIQGLGVQQEQYKTSMLDKVAGAQGVMGQQKANQWDLNVNIPWQTQMNEKSSQYDALLGNAANSRESATSSLMNFAGTQYYKQMMESLYPKPVSPNTPKK